MLLLVLVAPAQAAAPVDINHADARTLAESMHGVGLVRAEAIVAYRTAHGPFRRVEDLVRVDGIGAKTIAANRNAIAVVQPGGGGGGVHASPTQHPVAAH